MRRSVLVGLSLLLVAPCAFAFTSTLPLRLNVSPRPVSQLSRESLGWGPEWVRGRQLLACQICLASWHWGINKRELQGVFHGRGHGGVVIGRSRQGLALARPPLAAAQKGTSPRRCTRIAPGNDILWPLRCRLARGSPSARAPPLASAGTALLPIRHYICPNRNLCAALHQASAAFCFVRTGNESGVHCRHTRWGWRRHVECCRAVGHALVTELCHAPLETCSAAGQSCGPAALFGANWCGA